MSTPSEVLSPEERCERVRMALAEVGLGRVPVYPRPDGLVGVTRPRGVSKESVWRAGAITGSGQRCWPCYRDDPEALRPLCTHDPLTSPWPEVVR